jgi:hypothetical protein
MANKVPQKQRTAVLLTPMLVETNTGTQSTAETKSFRQNNKTKNIQEVKSTIHSLNIQGVKDPLKLEYITNMMKEQGIDSYLLLQETWLTSDFITYVHGLLMIHHGLETPACCNCNRGGTGGVAILLSPTTRRAWDKADNPPPTYSTEE